MIVKLHRLLLVTVVIGARSFAAAPACETEPGRLAEQLEGQLIRGETLFETVPGGWALRLVPVDYGWRLEITMPGREDEDISRLTPPWHFVPNPRNIEGWHFRNSTNTGPNDGSVNAPQELREFIFSPEVGVSLGYNGSATSVEDVEKVRSLGRGWLFIESYTLSPPREGEKAAFESLVFTACLTRPQGY